MLYIYGTDKRPHYEELIEKGTVPDELFKVRYIKTAKRVTLRFKSCQGGYFLITAPRSCKQEYIADIIKSNIGWVEKTLHKHREKQRKNIPLEFGQTIPVLGEKLRISELHGDGRLCVIATANRCAELVENYLRSRMQSYVEEKIQQYGRIIGKHPANIRIKEIRSRWGSCSKAGNINICWRLVFAPREVLDYVILHEMAHLIEMNHSPAFWKIVADICPDYKKHKDWLRKNGSLLFLYGAA